MDCEAFGIVLRTPNAWLYCLCAHLFEPSDLIPEAPVPVLEADVVKVIAARPREVGLSRGRKKER